MNFIRCESGHWINLDLVWIVRVQSSETGFAAIGTADGGEMVLVAAATMPEIVDWMKRVLKIESKTD